MIFIYGIQAVKNQQMYRLSTTVDGKETLRGAL